MGFFGNQPLGGQFTFAEVVPVKRAHECLSFKANFENCKLESLSLLTLVTLVNQRSLINVVFVCSSKFINSY